MASLWQKPREMRFGPWLIKARNEILSQQQALFWAIPRIKSCSKPIHRSPTYDANVPAWWRLVKIPCGNSWGHLSCSVACSMSPSPLLASWCFKQLLEPGLEDTVRNRYKKDFEFSDSGELQKENLNQLSSPSQVASHLSTKQGQNQSTREERDGYYKGIAMIWCLPISSPGSVGLHGSPRHGSSLRSWPRLRDLHRSMTTWGNPRAGSCPLVWTDFKHILNGSMTSTGPQWQYVWRIVEIGVWKALVFWEASSKWYNAGNSSWNSSWGNLINQKIVADARPVDAVCWCAWNAEWFDYQPFAKWSPGKRTKTQHNLSYQHEADEKK